MLLPVAYMNARLIRAKSTNETELFDDLLLAGEMLSKLVVVLLVAASDENTEGQVYGLEWVLVRADSLGKWTYAGRDLLVGPYSALLSPPARLAAEQLTTTTSRPEWHRQAVEALHEALRTLYPKTEKLPKQTSFVHWLLLMSELRNKTKGHGATPPETRAAALPHLESSVGTVATKCPVLEWPLVYAEQELSGRIKTVSLVENSPLSPILTDIHMCPDPCVYLLMGKARPVRLLFTNSRADDFWLPNGNYKDKQKSFESLSYCSGDTDFRNGSRYTKTPAPLPGSTTGARGDLQLRGKIFTNTPEQVTGYIRRPALEAELERVLLNEQRHPVITLAGPGGIGKTSLALQAVDGLTQRDRFFLVIWFSSRDIDLLDHGPKQVTPDVLTLDDVAKAYKQVMGTSSKESPINLLASALSSPGNDPTLFVFDNFETVRAPDELFGFIDDRIRPPNKVLITTRKRSFKGDYPIEVSGMEWAECISLIDDQARRLGIDTLLTPEYKKEVIAESEGHPYVIKILLGEVARERRLRKVERIIADREEILDALFDRTFKSLSEAARRVFLTLSAWRSTIPIAAIEAIMLRNLEERIQVDKTIDELYRYSFVELMESPHDNHVFVTVPLAASLFGRRQKEVSPHRLAVDADVQMLREFGPSQRTDVQHGIGPRILRMFKFVAQEIQAGRRRLADEEPMLQFLARKWPEGWLHLATLREQISNSKDIEGQMQALRLPGSSKGTRLSGCMEATGIGLQV